LKDIDDNNSLWYDEVYCPWPRKNKDLLTIIQNNVLPDGRYLITEASAKGLSFEGQSKFLKGDMDTGGFLITPLSEQRCRVEAIDEGRMI
jgi:hypothetical protein